MSHTEWLRDQADVFRQRWQGFDGSIVGDTAERLEAAADRIEQLEADKLLIVTAIERWTREQHASDWVAVIVNDDNDLQIIHEDPYGDDWIVVTEDGAS